MSNREAVVLKQWVEKGKEPVWREIHEIERLSKVEAPEKTESSAVGGAAMNGFMMLGWPFAVGGFVLPGILLLFAIGYPVIVLAIWLIPVIFMAIIGGLNGSNTEFKRRQAAYEEKLEKNAKLIKEAEARIEKAKEVAAKAASVDLEKYEEQVNVFVQKAMGNSGAIEDMVQQTATQFERRINQQPSGDTVRFINASLIYSVNENGIKYDYESGYSSAVNDFDFEKERFHKLNSIVECEGLAKAIAILATNRVKDLHNNATATITIEADTRKNATYKLVYNGVNARFQAKKDIF